MFTIRSILHPTDFSRWSNAAFQVARALALSFDARLVVVHVAPLSDVPEDRFGTSEGGWEYAWTLNDMREDYQAPEIRYPVEHRMREGCIVTEILREVRTSDTDLIVMGTQGRERPDDRVLGSIAEQLLHRAPCPVLTIKTPGGRVVVPELSRVLQEV